MSTDLKMTISEKLRHYRRLNSLSQEKLAETSGISIRTIQRMEEGKSDGSSYTILALAKALHIKPTDLTLINSVSTLPIPNDTLKLKTLNFSAITMFLIPLANIFIPLYIYFKNKDDEKVNTIGSKIISFQILWTLATLIILMVLPALLLGLFSALRASSIPLFIPIYFISSLCNVFFVLKFAININQHLPILEKVPNLL